MLKTNVSQRCQNKNYNRKLRNLLRSYFKFLFIIKKSCWTIEKYNIQKIFQLSQYWIKPIIIYRWKTRKCDKHVYITRVGRNYGYTTTMKSQASASHLHKGKYKCLLIRKCYMQAHSKQRNFRCTTTMKSIQVKHPDHELSIYLIWSPQMQLQY